jgi:hypothetical protein
MRFCAWGDQIHLSGVGLAGSLGLGTEVGGGAGGGEETADHGLEERVEDNLGTAGNWSVT